MKEIRILYALFHPTEEELKQIKEELKDELSSKDFAKISDDPLDIVSAYCEVFGVEEFIYTYCTSADPCGDPEYGPEMEEE